jgi:hypothetical protein
VQQVPKALIWSTAGHRKMRFDCHPAQSCSALSVACLMLGQSVEWKILAIDEKYRKISLSSCRRRVQTAEPGPESESGRPNVFRIVLAGRVRRPAATGTLHGRPAPPRCVRQPSGRRRGDFQFSTARRRTQLRTEALNCPSC